MRKRVISACLAMALLITMIPHFCLGVEASNPDKWNDFIATRAFWDYMSDSQSHREEDLEYAVFDLNADGVTELLLQDTWDAPFYSTWLFVLQDGKIVLANEDYGYGMYRYSPQYNMIIGSPETKPFSGTGTSPFYSLSGTEFKYEFQIGQDMGVSFYSDASGQRTISEDERASYYEDVVWLTFSPVSEVPESEPVQEPGEDAAAVTNGYIDAVESAVSDMQAISWGKGYGALYDVDGNGVEELLLIYHTDELPDDDSYSVAMVCSVYTMYDGNAIPLLEKEFLFYEAGSPWGYVGVVEKDEEYYLAVHSSNGGVEEYYRTFGRWDLYAVAGATIKQDTDLEYTLVEDFDDTVVEDESSVTIDGQVYGYAAYEEWIGGVKELFAVYPAEVPWAPQYENTMTLEELLEYLKENPVDESISDSEYQDYARSDWIRQHMEYAASDEYASEITGGYSEWMLAAFRDACEDSDVKSFQTRKNIVNILNLDFEFSEPEMYELILAELLYGNTSLSLTEEAYAQRLRTGAADISRALANIANNTDGLGDDIKKSINNLYDTLQTLDFGSDAYGKTYSELISMVDQNVSDVKGKLKADAIFAGYGILLDGAFERYDALEDILTYTNNYNAYQYFSQQTRAVLQQLVLETYVEHQYGMNELIDELGLWEAQVNWESFRIALEEIIAAMVSYENEYADVVAVYAVEREKQAVHNYAAKTIKTVAVFAVEKALSCVPVMNAILTAKNIISAGLQASVILDMIFTNVDEREYAIDVLVKAYCISFVLDETVATCGCLMTEDDFFSTTVFDESVSIYRKNQLLASDYMLKYADLVVADLLAEVEELELREQESTGIEKENFQFLIRKIWERLSWYSRHLKDLKAERAAIEAIACHGSELRYDPYTDEVIYNFQDSRIYVVACPVDVIVTADTGEQIACLSGENNQVADGYEFYFHTIKTADDSGEYIKVAIVPEGWQIELKGTGEGVMHAVVADYGADDAGEVETYFNIPIEKDSAGYFESGTADGGEGSLVMDQTTYSNMENVEDLPDYSEFSGVWVWIAGGAIVCVILLFMILRKKSH